MEDGNLMKAVGAASGASGLTVIQSNIKSDVISIPKVQHIQKNREKNYENWSSVPELPLLIGFYYNLYLIEFIILFIGVFYRRKGR